VEHWNGRMKGRHSKAASLAHVKQALLVRGDALRKAPKKVGRPAQGYRSADELTGGLFSGDFEIVSAPGAVPWEITAHRAPGKGEHDKSRADNLFHGHKSPSCPPMLIQSNIWVECLTPTRQSDRPRMIAFAADSMSRWWRQVLDHRRDGTGDMSNRHERWASVAELPQACFWRAPRDVFGRGRHLA